MRTKSIRRHDHSTTVLRGVMGDRRMRPIGLFGRTMRARRVALRMRRTEFARRVGLTYQQYWRYETGYRSPRVELEARLLAQIEALKAGGGHGDAAVGAEPAAEPPRVIELDPW